MSIPMRAPQNPTSYDAYCEAILTAPIAFTTLNRRNGWIAVRRILELRVKLTDRQNEINWDPATGVARWLATGAVIPPHVFSDAKVLWPQAQAEAYRAAAAEAFGRSRAAQAAGSA